MALLAHLGSMGDLQGSFEDGPKCSRESRTSLVNPGDEMELPWCTKTHMNLLLQQLKTKLSPFWNGSNIGNQQNAFLAKNPQIGPFEGPGN